MKTGYLYRVWPAYRKGLVEYDGKKILVPFVFVDVLMAVVFCLPPVVRATGISAALATTLIAAHLTCVWIAGYPLHALAQRRRWAFHLQVAMALVYNVGACLAFVAASHDPKTLLWMTLMIYAGICGASQEVEPSWAFLLTFLGAPFALIPCFAHAGARGPWTIAGPLLTAGLCGALYHTLAASSSAWRRDRAHMARRIAELERRQITRDIHDTLGSSLALLGICGDVLESKLAQPDEARPILHTMQRTAREGLVELREVLNGVASGPIALGMLGASLQRFADSAVGLTSARVAVELSGALDRRLPGDTRVALTRIFQEALSNALRHGRARNIAVRLAADEVAATLDFTDDGRGFLHDPAGPGRGLGGMRSRARELGGTLHVASKPGGGTRIAVRLPARGTREAPTPLAADFNPN